MKKYEYKLKNNYKNITKETSEERKERLRSQNTYTRVIESKKRYNRKKTNIDIYNLQD